MNAQRPDSGAIEDTLGAGDEHLLLLTEASRLLAEPGEERKGLRDVARLLVPRFADLCFVHALEADGTLALVVFEHVLGRQVAVQETLANYKLHIDGPGPYSQALRQGSGELVRDVRTEWTDSLVDAIAGGGVPQDELLAMVRRLQLLSVIFVPLILRGRLLGGIALATTRASGRRLDDGDLGLVEEVARLAALAQERGRMAAELEDKAAALLQAKATREDFLGLVSHELRTPVTTILGSAEVLSRMWEGLAEEDRAATVGAIEQDAHRLSRVIDDLFVLAQVTDRQSLAIAPLVLRRLIARRLDVHQRRYPERNIEFTSDTAEPPVAADASYVEQILRDLLDNAERYSRPDETIGVDSRVEGNEVAVRVLDRGAGIRPEYAELIFTAFYRPSKDGVQTPGVGAGLAASKRLVEAHGGRIWMLPREGGGTELGFTLPVAEGTNDE